MCYYTCYFISILCQIIQLNIALIVWNYFIVILKILICLRIARTYTSIVLKRSARKTQFWFILIKLLSDKNSIVFMRIYFSSEVLNINMFLYLQL
jgi:hypothetical protein